MPEIVTHFTNNLKNTDIIRNRLKQKAFIHPDTSEVSVVDIDWELMQDNANSLIFNIGDLIYTGLQKVKARGDMNVEEIEAITYGLEKRRVLLESAPTIDIPKHYNIKPDFIDLEFANICSYNLSIISRLVIKDI